MSSTTGWVDRPHEQRVDASLSALLVVQGLTLFVAIPLSAAHPAGLMLLDACHFAFAVVCVALLTRHHVVQGVLLAGPTLLVLTRLVDGRLSGRLGLEATTVTELIAFNAFAFNGLVTALVACHVFGFGRVTAHRVRGMVLLYLSVAALFAIAYNALETRRPGAFATTAGVLAMAPGVRTAALAYFSVTTITTTGYGDLVPMHPLARSLATLEAVFGQLFPATLLARLIALHLAHEGTGAQTSPGHGSLDRSGGVDAKSTDR